MQTQLYPWQTAPWMTLQKMRSRLPHAILLHGAAGNGKTDFATHFAQSLLCEQPLEDGQPCTKCDSCGWFVQYSHPDFRRVRPDALDEGDGAAADAGDEGIELDSKKTSKSAKAPSKDIRIEQVRALAGFMNISTHRNGKRVVLLYPAESLNNASANALLKTLEEPPPATVILLVTSRLDRLLPTIVSRCRQLSIPLPSREQAIVWMQAQDIADADLWLDEQGGAPLAALAQSKASNRADFDIFLAMLANPGIEAALTVAEKLQKSSIPELVAWLQRWLYDVFSCKLSGTIRYYPRYRAQLSKLAEKSQTLALMEGLRAAVKRRAVAEHPLSPKLFIEDMLLEYTQIFG